MKKLLIIILLLLSTTSLHAAENYLDQGNTHLSTGNYDKAIRSFELAVKNKQNSAKAYKGLGKAYYQLGNCEIAYNVEMIAAAVRAFDQSLAIKADPEVSYLLGLSYLALYEKEKAETAHASLQSADPVLAEKLAARIAAYVKPARFNFTPSTAPQGDQTAVVIEGNRVLVPVNVSYRDHSANATLLLDTGASVTSISERLAAQLGVAAHDTNPAMAIVADGRTVSCRWFVTDLIAVGPKSIPYLRTAILPGSMAGVDGLLGMDFLRNLRYHVNFSRNVIEWNSR
jgi:predicted aspartyl protease